jgi:hypothetical protein
MARKLQSSRIDEESFISAGPDKINDLETDVAEILGFDADQLYENSPFSFDEYGNILSARDGDGIQTRFKGSSGSAGFRVWNSSQDEEILFTIENGYLVISENTGTVGEGESANWEDRFKIELNGGTNNEPGQSILNHSEFSPSAILGTAGEVMAVNSAEDGLEFVSAGSLASADSAGFAKTPDAVNITNNSAWQVLGLNAKSFVASWDNNDFWDGSSENIDIPTDGIYQINMSAEVEEDGTQVVGLGYRTSAASGIDPGKGVRQRAIVHSPASGGNLLVISGSWMSQLFASDEIYFKVYNYSSGGVAINFFHINISITRISVAS